MATVLDPRPDPVIKSSSRIDEQLAQAVNRIRVHDLILGTLALAVVVAGYATVMILLDRYLNLAEWVRQLALGGLLLTLLAVGYALLVRPLTRRINPLYAAALVEQTIEDAKNSVTGYVDALENERAAPVVKAAISARAAKVVSEADLNQAVDHRSLLAVGGLLVALVVGLAILFFVFRPAQFTSLINRAFVPFDSEPIATRTQITLVRPEPPEPTITTGQTITVAVRIGGKLPDKNAADRPRVLLRHNPNDPAYEEVPLSPGESARDWLAKIPEYLVQNGFWYKVAAGDAETPEYRVTVRTLPLFLDYEASYVYPSYTRKPADRSSDPNIRAYRGTRVTLTARTNRQVAEGLMRFETPGLPPVVGRPTPGRPDSLTFSFTISEPTRYRLYMTTTEGEKNTSPPAFAIAVDSDSPPVVQITRPEEPQTELPANGLLEVDGTVGDDFGIDKVRLRLRVQGRDLAPIPYMGGQSFFRERDGSWPNTIEYKGSADLTRLTDTDGRPFRPQEGQTLEYWLEAIDNCSETPLVWGWGSPPGAANSVGFAGFSFQRGQVGRSETRTVLLTVPRAGEQQQQLDRQKQQRQNREQQHATEQQRQLESEPRQPPTPDPDRRPQDGPKDRPQPDPNPKQPDPQEGERGQHGAKQPDRTQEPKTDPRSGEPQPRSGQSEEPTPKDTRPSSPGEPRTTPPPSENPDSGAKPDPKAEDGKSQDGGASDPRAKTDPQPAGEPKGGMNADPRAEPDAERTSGTPKDGRNELNRNGTKDERPTAPPPQSPEERRLEEEAQRVEQELARDRSNAGDGKPNPSPSPQERTEPGQAKPEPTDNRNAGRPEAESKPAPDRTDTNRPTSGQPPAAESKPQGQPEQPPTRQEAKPRPDPKSEPAEPRDGPLGGSPGEDKLPPGPTEPKTAPPTDTRTDPKVDPKADPKVDPKANPKAETKANPKVDPKDAPASGPDGASGDDHAGGIGKPATPRSPEPGTQPEDQQTAATERAGEAKPPGDPLPGRDKATPRPARDPSASPEQAGPASPEAGDAKPPRRADPAGRKPTPADDVNRGQPQPDTKPPAAGPAAENKPDASRSQETPPDRTDATVEKGSDKPTGLPPQDVGSRPRSGEPEQKPGEPKQAAAGSKGTDDGSKPRQPDDRQRKEVEEAVKDLTSPDPAKQQAARDKLDRAVGEQNRKAIEKAVEERRQELDQLRKDLESPDENVRKAAEQKLDDLRRQLDQATQPQPADDQQGSGTPPRQPSPEEIQDLARKARELTSPDEARRQAAEQELDEKLGPDARKRLQEELRKRNKPERPEPSNPADPKPPADPADADARLQKQIEQELRNRRGGPDGNELLPPTEDDPRNRAKTAELQLEQFQRHRYDKKLHERLGWTQEKYDEFLKAQEERVRRLREQAERAEATPPPHRTEPAAPPALRTDLGGKVETRPGTTGPTTGSGAATAPPGFDEAKRLFQEALQKRDPKR